MHTFCHNCGSPDMCAHCQENYFDSIPFAFSPEHPPSKPAVPMLPSPHKPVSLAKLMAEASKEDVDACTHYVNQDCC